MVVPHQLHKAPACHVLLLHFFLTILAAAFSSTLQPQKPLCNCLHFLLIDLQAQAQAGKHPIHPPSDSNPVAAQYYSQKPHASIIVHCHFSQITQHWKPCSLAAGHLAPTSGLCLLMSTTFVEGSSYIFMYNCSSQ